MSGGPVLPYLDELLPLSIRLQTVRALKLDSASVSLKFLPYSPLMFLFGC